MSEINTLLIIDMILVFLGGYLLGVALKMKRTEKVDTFVVAEEVLKCCKDEKNFAQYLAKNMSVCSMLMMIGGAVMVIHELFFDLGIAWYIVAIIVGFALLWLFKSLSDGKSRFC